MSVANVVVLAFLVGHVTAMETGQTNTIAMYVGGLVVIRMDIIVRMDQLNVVRIKRPVDLVTVLVESGIVLANLAVLLEPFVEHFGCFFGQTVDS